MEASSLIVYADAIAKARTATLSPLLQFCCSKFRTLRDGRRYCLYRVSGIESSEADTCETINLGCLSRKFPDLEDLVQNEPVGQTISGVLCAIRDIKHLRQMRGLEQRFVASHTKCDIAQLLTATAEKYVAAVKGLDLESPQSTKE